MTRIKRLWTDEELIGMAKTISSLRRMRTAAVTQSSSIFLRLRRACNHFLGGQEQIYSQQEALSHTEELADTAGDFFAAKLSRTTNKNAELEKWQDLVSDATRQYLLYGSTTHARTSLGEVVGTSMIGRLRNINIDPDYMLHWDLIENNNLGVESIEELINQDIGVFSPLSGDYVMARTYSSYLQRTKGKSFPVRAVALNHNLSVIVLPVNADGKLPFEDKPEIGIYMDTTETGETARVTYESLQEAYQQKTVYEPKYARTEFTKSKKMEKFWSVKR